MSLFSRYMKEKKSDDHATLSASGSERWLNCAGSVERSKGIASQDNRAGIRGTNTHTLLQFILENEDWEKLLKTKEAISFLQFIEYDTAMRGNALFAAHYVWLEKKELEQKYGVSVSLFTEQKLELKGVGFGTSDIILYHPYGPLHVMDYKNGVKAVEPENNTQGLYYAYGAADKFNWEFSDLYITIIQPNASHSRGAIRTWTTNENILQEAGEYLRQAAKRTKKPNAPLKEGYWCYFCPARIKCPLHLEKKEIKLLERFGI